MSNLATASLWVAAAVALLLPTGLAFFKSGGYSVEWQTNALVVVLCALALVAAVGPWPPVAGRWGLAALAALAGLAGWAALSVSWAPLRGEASHDVVRVSLYCVAFALALAAMGLRRARSIAPDALLAGIAFVALYALAGRLLPEIVEVRNGPVAGERLNQPLTYWNALGLLTVSGVLLAIAVAADERRPAAWRQIACALAVPCGAAAYLTFSRGAWVALVVGLVALVLLRPLRSTLAAAALAIGATLLVVIALQAFPAVLDLDLDELAEEGRIAAAVTAVMAAAAGLGHRLLSPTRLASGALSIPRWGRRALLLATVALMAAGAAYVATRGEVSRNIPTGQGRLATVETNRGTMWRVGLDAFADEPLRGVGSAGFSVEWLRERDEPQRALDAHSIYIETLAELGLVGGLLLVAFGGSLALGLRRAARAAPGDPTVAAAGAVLAAFAVHAAFDWHWEMPTVALTVLVLAAAVLRTPEADPAEPRLSA